MPITKIPSVIVPDTQKPLLNELDKSRLVARVAGEAVGDGNLDPSEVKAALANLSAFSADEQATIKSWAQMLGVDAGPAAPAKKEWQAREPLPKDRTVYNATTVGGHLFASHGDQGYTTLSRFDPGVNTWTDVPNPTQQWWGNMMDPTLASLGNSLVALGGHGDAFIWPSAYKYDVDAKQWQQMPNPPTQRWGMGAADLAGKLYAVGGETRSDVDDSWNFTPFGGAKNLSAAAEVYDPAANAWSKLPDLPTARAHVGVIAAEGKIFVVGGLEGDAQYGHASNRVDVFDPSTGKWQDPPFTMPTAVVNPSLFMQDGKICVTGGVNAQQQPNMVIETLDPTTGKNGELPPVKFEDAGMVSVVNVGGDLVALGSMSGKDRMRVNVKELAPVEPPPGQGSSGGNVINVITNNNNITNVDVTNVLQNITNTSTVNNVTNVSETNVNVNNTSVSVIAPTTTNIFSDVDNNFFFRPGLKDKPLLQVGNHDGKRFLVGSAADGKGPMPKNADVGLFDPKSGNTFTCRTDGNGQFACAIPDDLHGRVFAFRLDNGQPGSMAAPIDVP